MARLEDNLAAVRLMVQLRDQDREATPQEQAVLARWSSWGALPAVFDATVTTGRYAQARAELQDLLTPQEWAAAARTTINAHYTDVAYARAMWDALGQLGATGDREVLEPGCGSGVFIGSAPSGTRMTGIELDPITAQITGLLYPSAEVRAESFVDTPFARDTFDHVVGNVPFGKVALYDPRHNAGRHSIHNHFILKGLDLLKPGGTMAVLTSRYTLDSQDRSARDEIYKTADLIGAVRLPSGAHDAVAGTAAVTDVLLLRKRLPGDDAGDNSWLTSQPLYDTFETDDTHVSTYFVVHHPENVLGEQTLSHGQYGTGTYAVEGRGDPRPDLQVALDRITATSTLRHDAERSPIRMSLPTQAAHAPTGIHEGTLVVTEDGIGAWHQGTVEAVAVPQSHLTEVKALIGLRERAVALLSAEAADANDTPQSRLARVELNREYDAYVRRYGPIGRFKLARTGRVDEDGNDVMRRMIPTAIRLLRSDPMYPTVLALEAFDPATQTATKAAIFTARTVAPRTIVSHADDPADALALALDATGRVDLSMIAGLMEVTEAEARDRLGTLVFDDPQEGRLVPAAEYLSGQVRAKLTHALEAAADDPSFNTNVAALKQVQPEDLTAAEITASLGAVWISAEDVTQFAREVLADTSADVTHVGGSEWNVTGDRHSVAATSTWGTTRLDAITMMRRLLKQQKIVVTDPVTDADGRETRVVNPVETEAAAEKATALRERFEEWVWEDPARAQRLARTYNDTFNATVLRRYDTDHMTLPGLALSWTPRPHQLAGVARMIAEPSVGLFHEVGAGKTATMVMGIQELKRLGMVSKPAIVVPNHMLEQFSREYLQLYPQAKILAASIDDLGKVKRRAFVARIATGDWDAVIMTRTAFEALPVSAKAQSNYEQTQMSAVRFQLERARAAGGTQTVKRLEAQLIRSEERLKRTLDRRRDVGVTFEQTGIDYLCVDELHDYKNLTIVSNIEGVARAGSQRATDFDMKLHVLRDGVGDRVVTGATATPIANTVSEAYVMQRYLRPELLDSTGITDFDSWAATFGEQITEVELAPEGAGNFRTVTRFARFRNVPEMLRMWHASADIRTAEDLNLPTPPLKTRPDGAQAAEAVVIAPSGMLQDYVAGLGERAVAVRAGTVEPTEDNMLVITSDGRKAALDMRLIHGPDAVAATAALIDVPTKLDVAAARIHRIWTEHAQDTFTDASGAPSPTAGALQIVFCDLGTPSAKWNVYDELRSLLVGHGMDPARVRFVHEAAKDTQKAELFAACRDGAVDVLIGSTSRMGVGTNIQRRAVALHHLDCPWRPADIAQREGRILRQGNQNPEVGIYRYVVEGSFDAYMWQTVERKAKFIAQVMRGRLDLREIEDIGDAALSFSEVKALASGDPRILEKAQADQDLVKLERLERAHHRAQSQLDFTITTLTRDSGTLEDRLSSLQLLLPRRVDTAGDAFAATIEGVRYTDRATAAEAIRTMVVPLTHRLDAITRPSIHIPANVTLGGLTIDIRISRGLGTTNATFALTDAPSESFVIPVESLTSGHGIITRLEHRIGGLDASIDRTKDAITRTNTEIETARAQAGNRFPRAAELLAARERSEHLRQAIEGKPGATPAPAPARRSATPAAHDHSYSRTPPRGLRP